jgi:3-oxoacyl-[acyl-carrier-protein] synthase III
MGPAFITAVGAAVPSQILTNEVLLQGMPWLDTSPEWVREHTGIRSRHVAGPDEHATDLGLQAALQALDRAHVAAKDTDMVILATNTSQFVYPAGAALIQQGLGNHGHCMPHAAALDVQQGCGGFLAGIILATAMVQSGACHQVLVIGADVATRMVDWTDRSCLLLGDGATACVVSDRRPPSSEVPLCLEVLGSFMQSTPDRESIFQRGGLDPRNHPLQHIEYAASLRGRITREALYARLATPPPGGGDCHFHMDGRKVYRFVRRTVPGSGYLEVLQRAGLVNAEEYAHLVANSHESSNDDPSLRTAIGHRIDRFVPHGANMVLDQELADQMHIPYERMALTLQEHGNTSAASVGIALERILRGETRYETIAKRDSEGHLTKPAHEVVVDQLRVGHNVLLLSFGAGTSWNYIAARAV